MSEQSGNNGGDSLGPLAVVTGASSGIGAATAEALADRGYRTVLMARREERLRELADRLSETAPSTALPLDLVDPEAVYTAFSRIVDEHGVPNVLVNAAGYGHYAAFLDHDTDELHRLMQVNYWAPLQAIRAVLPRMVEEGRGHIFNVSSISAKMGPWGHSGYAAAKAALVSLTETLAAEHAETPVRFSCVIPGIVRTEFFDRPTYARFSDANQRRAIPPQRLARAIVRAIDRPRLQIVVPAHYRMVDLMRWLAYEWTHRLVGRQSRPTGSRT